MLNRLIMVPKYCLHWLHVKNSLLILLATTVQLSSETCNYRAALHKTFTECTVSIEATCFNATTTELIESEEESSSVLQAAFLHVYTFPEPRVAQSPIHVHHVSSLVTSESSRGWYVPLQDDVVQVNESICIKASLYELMNELMRNSFCINNCAQSEEVVMSACEGVWESVCTEISVALDIVGGGKMAAIVEINGTSYLRRYSQDSQSWSSLILSPSCFTQLMNYSFHGFLHWVYSNSSSYHSEDCRAFKPRKIVFDRLGGIFVIGDSGLLYSSNMEDFHELQLPREASVSSFDSLAAEGGQFLLTTNASDQGVSIYFGLTGTAEVMLITGEDLQALLNYQNFTLDSVASVEWNRTDHIAYIVLSDNSSSPLPLFPLLSNSWKTHTSNFSQMPVTPSPSRPFSSSLLHELVTPPTSPVNSYYLCPFTSVDVIARICSVYTRTKFSVQYNLTSNFTHLTRAYERCNNTVDWLPWTVYLPFTGSYNFSLIFKLQLFDPTALFLSIQVSKEEVVHLEVFESWNPTENSKSYQVIVSDSMQHSFQVRSGYHVAMTTLSLQVWNAGLSCISNSFGPMKVHNPSYNEVNIKVGCPPGLGFIFDEEDSVGTEDQYCKQEENRTCYYFENDFHPVFKIVDEITGTKQTYLGKYSLRVLAGGISLSNMEYFDPSSQIESTIWSPTTDYYSNDTLFDLANNGIRWLCSPQSPCGNILPTSGGTPEYCLLLEASNLGVGINSSYCHFNVEFTVCVHGIGMGTTGVVTSFLLSIFLFSAILGIGFIFWFWKTKVSWSRLRGLDTTDNGTEDKSVSVVKTVREMIRRHREKVEEEKTSIEERVE